MPEVPAQITEQSEWYGAKARHNRSVYVRLKTLQIILAATIPVVAVFESGLYQRAATAILGALVGIVEGILALGQYQQNWLLYRATRQALQREELLFSEGAGPYAEPDKNPNQLFIERADAIMSGETASWVNAHQQPKQP